MSSFVTVGNNKKPFTRLLQAVAEMAQRLPQPVVVQHGHTPFSSSLCTCIPFMGMDQFQDAIRNSELVIMHAGAGSILRAIEARKVPVIVPRLYASGEHVNDHQLELARELETTGKIVVAKDVADLPEIVQEALRRQAQLASGASGTGQPGAGLIGALTELLAGYSRGPR